MTSPAIPAFPAHIPFAVLPSNAPALLAPHNPVAHSAFQTAISPGSLRNCIRLRGMPYSATIDDIVNFLGDFSLYILHSGVHIVLNQQGRPSGDAFIQLTSVEKASHAGMDVSKGGCHKKHMGERYVEVFQCSGDEMNMVLMGGTLNRNGIAPPPGMTLVSADTTTTGLIQTPPISNTSPSISSPFILQAPHGQLVLQHPIVASPAVSNFQPLDLVQTQALLSASRTAIYPQPTLLPYPHYLPTPPVSPGNTASTLSLTSLPGLPSVSTSALVTQEDSGSICGTRIQLRMQNLPFNVTVSEIMEFLKDFKLEHNAIKLIYNDKLHPTGEALVTFNSLHDAQRALIERNRKPFGNRFVDLVLP